MSATVAAYNHDEAAEPTPLISHVGTRMFDTKTRLALWNANQRKCFYCAEPVFYRDLEIDHIVPEKTTVEQLMELRSRIGLPTDFALNSLYNLVPTHHGCNNRKGGVMMDDQVIIYYQQLWAQKQEQIHSEIAKHKRAAARDRSLIAISRLLESGYITKIEIWQVISKVQPSVKPLPKTLWSLHSVQMSPNYSRLEHFPKRQAKHISTQPIGWRRTSSSGSPIHFQRWPSKRKPRRETEKHCRFELRFGTLI